MRILMVEDDKELCVALSICFQAAGYEQNLYIPAKTACNMACKTPTI